MVSQLLCIVGRGRLGSALARALGEAAGGGRPWTVQNLAGRTPPEEARAVLAAAAQPVALLLAVPDDALLGVATRWAEAASEVDRGKRPPAGRVALHMSGFHGPGPLAPLASAGFDLGGLHLLRAVGPQAGGAELAGASGALFGAGAALGLARDLAAALGLRPLEMPPEARSKALYHAGASLVAGAVVAAVAEAQALLAAAGLDPEAARQALADLAGSAAHNLGRGPAERVQTGPVPRGDAAVVAGHLEVLARERCESPARLYLAVAESLLALASEARSAEDGAKIAARLERARREFPWT